MRAVRAVLIVWAGAALLGAAPAGATASPTARAQMRALQHARWIREGSAHPRHVIYVFMDANCPYCRALWMALKPHYRSGLQVRDILVGVISASSPGKAAAIWDAADPSAALGVNETRWGLGPDAGGGIAPVAHPSSEDMHKLAHNEALMQAFGIEGTPGLVFCDAGGRVYVVDGLPDRNALAQIVSLASVPEQVAQAIPRH